MKVLKNKSMAWGALLLIMIILVCTFSLRPYWWSFFDIFFLFMMAFCHAVALTIEKMNRNSASKLETIALIMGILAIVSFIVEGLLYAFLTL